MSPKSPRTPSAVAPPARDSLLASFGRPGELSFFGGRPAMGSTTVALNLALALQEQTGGQALYFDLDPRNSFVEARLRGIRGEIPSRQALFERTHPPNLPIRLWEGQWGHIRDVVACCRRAAQDQAIAVVVIDWVQLLFGHPTLTAAPRHIAHVLVELSALATELEVPVVALSSLSRALEKRADKHPRLSDFTEVGLPRAAGHRFLAIYRALYYAEPKECLPDAPWETAEVLVWADGHDRRVYPFGFDACSGRMQWEAPG